MSRSAAARTGDQHDRRAARSTRPAIARRVSGPLRPATPAGDGRVAALSHAALAARPAAIPGAALAARPAAIPGAALAARPAALPRGPLAPRRARPVRRAPRQARPPLRLAAGGASIALRVAEATLDVSASRTMDRLVRSRAWVMIVAFALIGIVAMQVSLLKLNSGIGNAVQSAATLERTNAALRAEVSRLSSGERIQSLAAARGFVMPEPGDVTYLRAGSKGADGRRAASRMTAPDAAQAGPAGSVSTPAAPGGAATPDATTQAAAQPAAVPAPPAAGAAPAAGAPNGAGAPAAGAANGAGVPAPGATAAPAATPSGGVTVP